MSAERAALVKRLVECFGRHKPQNLTVAQTVSVIRRLIKHALAADSGCCLWGGAVNNSHYGKLNIRKFGRTTQLYVHQLAHKLAHDPRDLPPWMHVSHSCDVPPCFHPDHVRKERRVDNQRRSAENTHRKRARRRAEQQEAA